MPTTTPSKPIPLQELNLLVSIILQAYYDQYQRVIDPATISYQFITPRQATRFGFEINTVEGAPDYYKARLYVTAFVVAPSINPFRIEEVQDKPIGYGDEVFVSISELALDQFPILSQTLNPQVGSLAGPGAIQLEDLSGYIQLEDLSGYAETESGQ